MIRLLRNIAASLIALGLVLFSIESTGQAEVGVFPLDAKLSLPAFLLVFAGLFLGVLLAWVVPVKRRMTRMMQLREAQRKNKRLEQQVADLQQFKSEATAARVRAMETPADDRDAPAQASLPRQDDRSPATGGNRA